MNKYFKTIQGELINVVDHTIQQMEKYPNLTIRISTDSQSIGIITRYATVIVYRYGTNGAHYITFKQEVPRERVEYTRLYNEGLRTLEAEEMLRNEIPSIQIEALEFDYADVKKTISSALVSVFKGYRNAMFKSDNMFASKAGDHECRTHSNLCELEQAA